MEEKNNKTEQLGERSLIAQIQVFVTPIKNGDTINQRIEIEHKELEGVVPAELSKILIQFASTLKGQGYKPIGK